MTDNLPELSAEAKSFKLGVYRHFKTKELYETLCVGRSTEDLSQECVVYRNIEKGLIWIRPLKMFIDNVNRDGYTGPRFIWVSEKNN